MKENKKYELQKSLEELDRTLQELKGENPDGNFDQLENMIKHLQKMLDSVDNKHYMLKSIFKGILFAIALYLIYVVCLGAMMGFNYNHLNISHPKQLFYMIPSIALVLMLSHRLISIFTESIRPSHIIITFILFYIFDIFLLAIIDSLWIHIGNDFLTSLFTLAGVTLLSGVGEYYLTKKMLFW